VLKILSNDLSERGIKFDPVQRRIQCHGHVINIIVQAFLFAKDQEAVDAGFEASIRALAANNSEVIEPDQRLAEQFRMAADTTWREIGGLGKIHNLVIFIRGSNDRIRRFVQIAGRMIPMDNNTRWNSWFLMLEVALSLRLYITRFMEEYSDDLQLDYLTPAD
jgi:hypothetical protein